MLRRKITALSIALVFPIGLIACLAPHGIVRTEESGRVYSTTTEMAIDLGRQDLAARTAGIEPVESPLGGQVRVVLPSEEQFAWVVGTVSSALEKSELFDMVIVQEEADTRNPTTNGFDYVLWLDVHNGNQAQWYLRRADSLRREPVLLSPDVDRSQLPRAWINAVHEAGVTLATKSRVADVTQPVDSSSSDGLQRSSSGSGFVVSPDGFVLTASQVVDGCTRLVTEQDGQEVEMTLVRSDPANDLALLKLPQHAPGVARFSDGKGIDLRERVSAVGYPLRELLATRASVTDGNVTSLTGPGEDGRLLRITAAVEPGTIGGPLTDRSGRIVGVVAGPLGTPGIVKSRSPFPEFANFVIKGSLAERFLQESRVGYRTAGEEQHGAEARTRASNATIPIHCYKTGSGV